jgi:pSer/pThr/pTyr-binding forkhead associated (FHA) protein
VIATDAFLVFPNGAEYPLSDDIHVGRDPGNELVLPTKSISREHAQITAINGRWFVEDRGSYNGTRVNGERIRPGTPLRLRDGDRVTIGPLTVVFRSPSLAADEENTESLEDEVGPLVRPLSPLQQRIVGLLCGRWFEQGERGPLPSNEEIAAALGTPGATDTVKAALRRAYRKAGISALPAHEKRRMLCRVARERGWA